ncbi:MAG: hypothetical protein J6Y79_01650 [Paludibacteraceae bacterium]|nr:hypothetical protein [Paludibacteraceae bacterium]
MRKMKSIKRYTYVLLLLTSSAAVSGQSEDSTVIRKDIMIEKAYTPTIRDAGKINSIPSISEPVIRQEPIRYSDYSVAMDPEYQVRTLEAARLKTPMYYDDKNGYFRLGFGNCWSTLGDLVLPIVDKPKYSLGFDVHHKGILNKRRHHKSDAGLAFNRHFTNGDFFMKGTYGYRGFNYYGDNKLVSDLDYTIQTDAFKGKNFFEKEAGIHTFGATIGYKTYTSSDLLNRISASVGYDGFLPSAGLTEHRINTDLLYDRLLDENHWGIGFNMKNFAYDNGRVESQKADQDGFTVVTLNPYFQFEQERWNLRIGVNGRFSTEGKAFAPSADIKGIFALVPHLFFVYGEIGGDYQVNSMSETIEENHYVNLNTKIANTYTPFDLRGGIKFKLLYNLLTDLSVRYRKIEDQYFYVNATVMQSGVPTYSNVFVPMYSDASVLTPSLRLTYNFNQMLDFLLSAQYNDWSVDERGMEAYNMPSFEFNLGTTMHLGKRMSANLNTYIATGREARKTDGGTKSLKNIYDLNLGFFYTHSSKISMFIKLNNILHQHYEQYLGYDVNGFNGLIGISYSF